MGMSSSRLVSLAACNDTARFTGSGRAAKVRIPGTMPMVDTVRWRADSPRSPWMRSMAPHTLGSLAKGSPMPMNTTLARRRPMSADRREARATCSTISPVVSWRVKPAWPVAQNPQPMAQPAWLDTQAVTRSGYTMSTVSIRLPSSSRHRYFTVSPSSLTRCTSSARARGNASVSRARSALGRLVSSSGVFSCSYRPLQIWSSR